MLHTKFPGNLPAVHEKILLPVFTGHLGHVTSFMLSDFHFLVTESFHTKFGSDRHSSF